ncbi:hypothetical protein [Kitasatospora sp. KL5]|uniref:hypothetical protein n=1 Tax=Kitasatospora sp. KL5 TaxID=3425125 RepID=UPI003D700006
MGDKFGYQLQELAKIQNDFQKINQRMAEMTQKVGAIKSAIGRAAAMDVAAGGPLGVVNFFAVAYSVARHIEAIERKADALEAAKKQLTDHLGEDAQKIKKVIAEYEAAERKILEDLKGKHDGQEKPKGPHTGIDGTGGGKGGGNGGGGSGGGGGHHNTPDSPHTGTDSSGNDGSGVTLRPGGRHDGPKIKDRSDGTWKTHMINGKGWDDWSPSHKWHPRNGGGAGALAQPKLEGVSDERRAMVERAMERVNRKLGYSQGAVTNGYRVDCSGFVSAAWGLNTSGGGTSTGPLISESAGIAHHISKGEMKPGDAMVVHREGGSQHVVLFGGWADASHTRMIVLEDSGSRGCVSRETSLSEFSSYTAIRKNGM